MKRLLPFIIISAIILASCSERDSDYKAILKIEDQLTNDTSMVLDRNTALKLIDMYSSFSDKYPEDELADDYLFKAGEISMNLNMGNQAITFFTKILNNHANYEKRAETLFLQAFIFENQLNNESRATELYKSFMTQYPDHVLYKDAQASIDNMGLSLEEIIQKFERNRQHSDSISNQN